MPPPGTAQLLLSVRRNHQDLALFVDDDHVG